MVLPRLSRIVLGVLVLLANVATPDLVCAEHGNHGGGSFAEAEHEMGDHHPGPTAPADPCDEPIVPHCCPAVMACSFSLDAGQVRITFEGAGSTGIATVRWSGSLLSHSTSPDPPPPKA